MKTSTVLLAGLCCAVFAAPGPLVRGAGNAALTLTTARQPFANAADRLKTVPQVGAADLKVDALIQYQEIKGFGGSFNEKGWTALSLLPDSGEKVLADLFAPEGIARFTVCRVPVGSSDYAESRYSLNEAPGDLAMEKFSLARDRERLIPYVKAAKRFNPALKLWGSAWSPPTWMKTNGAFDSGAMRDEPAIYAAYALYLLKFAQGYQAEGLEIEALCPQNEPGQLTDYSSCDWTGNQLRDFIRDHMGPLFLREKGPAVWLGTINVADLPRFIEPTMSDPAAARYVSAFGLQWAALDIAGECARRWPGIMIAQTETECGNNHWQPAYNKDAPPNDWKYGVYTWGKIRAFFAAGASIYEAWNMVLDTQGRSIGTKIPWPQNALVTVSPGQRVATYTPAFWAFAHYSHFVQTGARRVALQAKHADQDAIAFRNPDGSVVVVLSNGTRKKQQLTVDHGGARYQLDLPATCFATLVLP